MVFDHDAMIATPWAFAPRSEAQRLGSESGDTKKASATDTAKKGSSEKKSTGKVASPAD